MLLDRLRRQDSYLCVGIGHLRNEKHLGKDDLIRLSSKTRKKILAVQFLDSSLIAGDFHILSAAQNAVNAWSGGYAVSRGLDVEIAVYASGQRQIGPALQSMGVHDDLGFLALVVVGDDDSAVKGTFQEITRMVGMEMQPAFPMNPEKKRMIMKHFGIGEEELKAVRASDDPEEVYEALAKCVASRVSMVAIDT